MGHLSEEFEKVLLTAVRCFERILKFAAFKISLWGVRDFRELCHGKSDSLDCDRLNRAAITS